MRLTDNEQKLLDFTLNARDEAKGSVSELIDIVQKNMDYYLGVLPKPTSSSSSKVVDKLIYTHVEGAVSQVLPIFTSMENKALEFTPLNRDDIETCEALTHYISEKVLHKNNGKDVLENAIREALAATRISWIKTTWNTETNAEQKTFYHVNKTQLKKLQKQHDVVEYKENKDKTYSGYVLDYVEESDLLLENIPLQNMLFPAEITDLKKLPYIAQQAVVTKQELLELFDEETVESIQGLEIGAKLDYSSLSNVEGLEDMMTNTGSVDENSATYILTEHYVRTSIMAKGKGMQWVQLFTCNDHLLEWSIVKSHPFTPIVPLKKVNSAVGLSFADVLKDLQNQRTGILRASLDNTLNIAYPRYQAVRDGYDVQSLLNNVAGGVIEVENIGNVSQFVETVLPSDVYNLFNILGSEAQKLTGVSDMNQGLDPNVLKGNTTAAAVITQMNAATKRILTYAKNIAEDWRDVLVKSYDYIRDNSNKVDITYIGGKEFVLFDSKFVERKMVLTPVFGTDENMAQAQLLLTLADRYKADPALAKSYNPYIMEGMILDAMGIPNRHVILTDPNLIPMTEEEVYQQQLNKQTQSLQLQSLGADVQLKTTQAQVAMVTVQNDANRVEIEAIKVTGEQEYKAEDIAIKQADLQLKANEQGLKGIEISQAGEIAAMDLNLRQVEFKHKATTDLANSMLMDTEIKLEQSQGRPVKFG